MKNNRQSMILDIIAKEPLRARGERPVERQAIASSRLVFPWAFSP